MARVCSICRGPYYRQSETDPDETCVCGQMASGTPWQWDRWRGIRNWLRYKIADGLFLLVTKLTERRYR